MLYNKFNGKNCIFCKELNLLSNKFNDIYNGNDIPKDFLSISDLEVALN